MTRWGRGLRLAAAVLAAGLALGGLAGCAEYQAARGVAVQYGTEAADRGVEDSLFYLCRAATVGAIRRWVGENEQRMMAWNVVCTSTEAPALLMAPLGSDGAGQGAAPHSLVPGGLVPGAPADRRVF